MMNSLFTIILIALAASFLPLQFGAEISLLGSDRGVRKAASLVGGITLFRIAVAAIILVLFAGATDVLRDSVLKLKDVIVATLSAFGMEVVSGERTVLDGLLLMAGILLLIRSYRSLREAPEAGQTPGKDAGKVHEIGSIGLILFGFLWMVMSINQWIFVTAGIGQILTMPLHSVGRLIVFILFLLFANLMIVLPILIVLVRPQGAGHTLARINSWVNGALRYVAIVGLFAIGLFLILRGTQGLMNSLAF